jgi:hypothetical protein
MNHLLMTELLSLVAVQVLAVAALLKLRTTKSDKRWMPDIRRVL